MTPEEMKLARLNIPKVAGPSTSSLRSDIAATDAWTLALLNAEYAARGVDALKAAVSGIETVVMLTPEQLAELSENVAASVVAADNSLTEEDLPAIKEQVKQAMREGTAPPASTVEP